MKVTSCFFKAFKAINRSQPTLQPLQLELHPMLFMCHNHCMIHCFTPSVPINNYKPYHHFSNEGLVPESHFVCLVSRTSLSFSVLAGFLPEISLRRELIDSLFEKGVVPGNGEANTKCLYLSWSPLCAIEACFCRNLLKSHVRYIAELSCEGTEEGVFIHH